MCTHLLFVGQLYSEIQLDRTSQRWCDSRHLYLFMELWLWTIPSASSAEDRGQELYPLKWPTLLIATLSTKAYLVECYKSSHCPHIILGTAFPNKYLGEWHFPTSPLDYTPGFIPREIFGILDCCTCVLKHFDTKNMTVYWVSARKFCNMQSRSCVR